MSEQKYVVSQEVAPESVTRHVGRAVSAPKRPLSGDDRDDLHHKFAPRVDVSDGGCHEWRGGISVNGYGFLRFRARRVMAHHAAWVLRFGVWPNYLMHSCDNRVCVNTRHLSEGSQALNNADMYAKGRRTAARGERSGLSKLTESSVQSIRARLSDGESAVVLASEYGVHKTTIYRAVRGGRNWQHV